MLFDILNSLVKQKEAVVILAVSPGLETATRVVTSIASTYLRKMFSDITARMLFILIYAPLDIEISNNIYRQVLIYTAG